MVINTENRMFYELSFHTLKKLEVKKGRYFTAIFMDGLSYKRHKKGTTKFPIYSIINVS